MTPRVRVQSFSVSADGIGAGENQTLERPFGDVDPGVLHAWAFATASFPARTGPGGSRGLEDYLTRDFAHGVGAEIMGRNKFGQGLRLWERPEDLAGRFQLEKVTAPSGVTHCFLWRW